MNAQGYVFLVDRAKDMIISGGENVYSTEVESPLQAPGRPGNRRLRGARCDVG